MKLEDSQKPRPPVVVVMGHVDHGKTTLLDYIRKANVASREAGGITQSVGAYEIVHQGRKITFIDTPGHEAFSKMRTAGAEVADLAILVIAADDGVKPQTKEAIKILAETQTPFVVAINKIDKPDANLDKAKNDLASAGVFLEGFGGQVSFHGVSAKTGAGVDELLDLVLLASDIENRTYNAMESASGYILETRMDRRRGLEVVAILKNGVLHANDFIATPSTRGKVKILENFLMERVSDLEPSAPCIIIGFETLPKIGEKFTAGSTEESLAHVAETAADIPKITTTLSENTSLKLILKASDAGSLEALANTIRNLKTETKPVIFSESVGDVTDGDIKMAIATNAVIIAFKSRVNAAAKNLAEAQKIKIITSEIIYELIQAVELFLTAPAAAALAGELEVLAVFNKAKLDKQLVGGKVIQGNMRIKANIEIIRADETIGRGKITSLQSQKKDVNSVPTGNECGLVVQSDIAIATGDHLVIR